MLTLAPFTFCANNVPGTDPIRAMDMARRCGFHTIELSAIDGISEQIAAERAHLAQQRTHILARRIKRGKDRQRLCRILLCDGLHQLRRALFARKAERRIDAFQRHGAVCRRRALVKQAHAVAHAAVSQPGQKIDRLRLNFNMLLIGDEIQPGGNFIGPQALEREPLAAGQNRRGNLLQFGRRQNE